MGIEEDARNVNDRMHKAPHNSGEDFHSALNQEGAEKKMQQVNESCRCFT